MVCLQSITGIVFLAMKAWNGTKKRNAEAQRLIRAQQKAFESECRARTNAAFTVRLIDARDRVASVVRPVAAALRRSRHDVDQDGRFSFGQDDVRAEEEDKKTSHAEDTMPGSVGQSESLDVTDADTDTLGGLDRCVLPL